MQTWFIHTEKMKEWEIHAGGTKLSRVRKNQESCSWMELIRAIEGEREKLKSQYYQ